MGYGKVALFVLFPRFPIVHAGYFEYITFSDDEILKEIWLVRLVNQPL